MSGIDMKDTNKKNEIMTDIKIIGLFSFFFIHLGDRSSIVQ